MSKKYILILGLLLAAGFLFLNNHSVLAADKYWTGNAGTSTPDGGKDFWNVANWDTAVPVSGDNIWLFATTSQSTIVISTPVSLGTGNIFVGYNQKGNTLANSSAPLNLLLKEGASLTNTGTFEVGTSSTVFLNSGSLNVGTTTIDQAASTTINAVSTGGATSTVTIAGNFIMRSAALYTSPSNSTTTINLPSGTSGTTTFSTGTSTPTFGYLVFGGTGTTNLQNSVTVANRLNIAAGRTLNAGGGTITLSGSNSNSSDFPLEVTGTFTAATSTVTYSSTAATTIASTTYYALSFTGGSGTDTLGGNTTATNAVTVASGNTLALAGFTFTATGSTWTNNGTVTEGGGKITLASATNIASSNGSQTAAASFNADNRPSVYITVNDPSLNLLAGTIETLTATITAKSGISTTQTVTLTETGASTGIFSGGLTFTLSGSPVTGALAYQGNGTITYAFTDPQDSSDTGTGGTATFTGTAPGGGGGGGGGAVSVTTAPLATTVTPTTVTTTTSTPTVITPTPSTQPAAPTLDSVQAEIASVVTNIASLTKNSSATDIAAVQAQISAILSDIQTLQAAQPTAPAPQGAALGFNFVKPLALGMSGNDVKNLQTALKTDPAVYPEGTVSGRFGPATLRAVQRFQEKYGIASKGDAGYGKVGPKTRTKLNQLYGGK